MKNDILTRLRNYKNEILYRQHYLQHLITHHQYFDIAGLKPPEKSSLKIQKIFVSPHLEFQAQENIELYNPLRGHLEIWNCFGLEEFSDAHLAIIADSGYGKTALLMHIILSYAHNWFKDFQLVPILLSLREHESSINKNGQELLSQNSQVVTGTGNQDFSLLQAIQDSIAKHAGTDEPPEWFARKLQQGKCLIMIDGLDEFIDPTIRNQVENWLKQQMLAYSENRFIITFRSHVYHNFPLNKMAILEVMNFNIEQVQEFVHSWYLTAIRTESSKLTDSEPGVQKEVDGLLSKIEDFIFLYTRVQINLSRSGRITKNKAKRKAEDFLEQTRKDVSLYKLSRHPFLLSLMVYVHHVQSELLKRQVDIFAAIYKNLLSRPCEVLGTNFTEKQKVLQPLAFTMMTHHQADIDTKKAQKIIKAAMTETLKHVDTNITEVDFLDAIESSSGLLWKHDTVYSFAHLIFQEYLTAVYIQEKNMSNFLVERLDDTWWHGTIRFYCALSDATPIIRACLSENQFSEQRFRLALECLEETSKEDPRVYMLPEDIFYQCLKDERRKRIVTEALENIRSNRFLRLSDDKFIDTACITHMEYQIFLQEMWNRGEHRQPDHRFSESFPQENGLQPATGIRFSDAVAFCDWLNSNEETGQWRYRLPKTKELKIRGLFQERNRSEIDFWVKNKNGGQYYGYEGPIVKKELLLQQILEDIFGGHCYSVSHIFNDIFHLWSIDRILRLLKDFEFSPKCYGFDFSRNHYRELFQNFQKELVGLQSQIENPKLVVQFAQKELDEIAGVYEDESGEIGRNIYSIRQKIDEIIKERDDFIEEKQLYYTEECNRIEHQKQECIDQITQTEEDKEENLRQIEEKYQTNHKRINDEINSLNEAIKQIVSNCEIECQQFENNYQKQCKPINQDINVLEQQIQCEITNLQEEIGQIQSEIQELHEIIKQNIVNIKKKIRLHETHQEGINIRSQENYAEEHEKIEEHIVMFQKQLQKHGQEQNDNLGYSIVPNDSDYQQQGIYKKCIQRSFTQQRQQIHNQIGHISRSNNHEDRLENYRETLGSLKILTEVVLEKYKPTINDLQQQLTQKQNSLKQIQFNKEESINTSNRNAETSKEGRRSLLRIQQGNLENIENTKTQEYNEANSECDSKVEELEYQIEELKGQIEQKQSEKMTAINNIHNEYAPILNQHQYEITQLQAQLDEHASVKTSIINKSNNLTQIFGVMLENTISILVKSQNISNFIHDYFCTQRQNIYELEEHFKACLDNISQMETILQEIATLASDVLLQHNLSDSENLFPVEKYPELNNLIQNLDILNKMINNTKIKYVEQLKKLIDFSIQLESYIETTSTQVKDANLERLPQNQINSGIAGSFLSAYDYIVQRHGKIGFTSADIRNRLHYVRLCALTLCMEIIRRNETNETDEYMLQRLLFIYVKLYIIEDRMRGQMLNSEAIRIMKVRKV